VALNPTWYEPCEFMAYASGLNSQDPRLEANAAQWMRMCASSTNENVLFFRPPGPETPIGKYPKQWRQPATVTVSTPNDVVFHDNNLIQKVAPSLEPALL